MSKTYAFSAATELDIRQAISAYKRKTHFDMCVELYKQGMISRDEFIRRAQHDLEFNPEPSTS